MAVRPPGSERSEWRQFVQSVSGCGRRDRRPVRVPRDSSRRLITRSRPRATNRLSKQNQVPEVVEIRAAAKILFIKSSVIDKVSAYKPASLGVGPGDPVNTSLPVTA